MSDDPRFPVPETQRRRGHSRSGEQFMGKKDRRVDSYIAKSAEFARPILKHLRTLVHKACPEIAETIKWNMPWFEHKGLVCGMAAFKKHATFGLWKHKLIVTKTAEEGGMGQFGRITSLRELPPDKTLLDHIRKAVELNQAGIKSPPRKVPRPSEKRELIVPDFFRSALKKNRKAAEHFDKFSYSHRKEYVEWLSNAKRAETRQKRLATALVWISQGKPQNWKYLNC